MKRITPLSWTRAWTWFAWAIVVVLALGFGTWIGAKVTAAYKDVEIMDLQVQLETANAELAFWKVTLHGLAEGQQLEGAELNGRPSLGD